jgi:hypothetical protein
VIRKERAAPFSTFYIAAPHYHDDGNNDASITIDER